MNTALKWQRDFANLAQDKTLTQLLHLYGDVNRVNFGDALEATQAMWKMRYIEYRLSPFLTDLKQAFDMGYNKGYEDSHKDNHDAFYDGYKEGHSYWLNSKRDVLQPPQSEVSF